VEIQEVNAILNKTNAKQTTAYYPIITFPIFIGEDKIEISERHTLNVIQPSNFFARIAGKKIMLTEIQQNIVDCFYTREAF